MKDGIEVDVVDHIAHVRLNRPDHHNAIEETIMEGLLAFARKMMQPGEVRVIVLSGNGKSFCAGLDMNSFADMSTGDLSSESENVSAAMSDISPGGANRAQQIGWLWQEVPVPVIAAVQGAALGGVSTWPWGPIFELYIQRLNLDSWKSTGACCPTCPLRSPSGDLSLWIA